MEQLKVFGHGAWKEFHILIVEFFNYLMKLKCFLICFGDQKLIVNVIIYLSYQEDFIQKMSLKEKEERKDLKCWKPKVLFGIMIQLLLEEELFSKK